MIVRSLENGKCEIEHTSSKNTVQTDRPIEFGGGGNSFSSTDLLAAAFASCTLTTIDQILMRENVNLQKIEVQVSKTLSSSPKRLESIDLKINLPCPEDETLLKKLVRAADACVVKKSLSADIAVKTEFLFS